MTRAFRLCKTKFLTSAFSGEGARLNGGRWNSPGLGVVYASSSLSLATLEVLVHLEDPEAFARLFSWIPLEIPDGQIEEIDDAQLPNAWCADETNISSRHLGDTWLRSMRSAVLAVPSVITPGERNFLLNPAHSGFSEIQIGAALPFQPDPRLAH
ncbi:MAG: RES family NAD+ phosphorylase [Luteolibacter sp.]|uniref:RES family NAD+ phosphorylase n=1 Tax=Luteolibacter sp. TaxID=1962973 RepID=UPI0032641199